MADRLSTNDEEDEDEDEDVAPCDLGDKAKLRLLIRCADSMPLCSSRAKHLRGSPLAK